MPDDAARRLAREIRAARHYAGMSRAQLGREVDLDAETIGRYERGQWTRPLKKPLLDAIARATEIPAAYLDAGFLAPDDPATRFAESARREARRQHERPASDGEARPDAGAEGATK